MSSKQINILSIDAWRDGAGWTWNNWHKVGAVEVDELYRLDSNRKVLNYLRKEGYLSSNSKGKVSVEDDQYNLVIVNKNTGEPLLAIEYGANQ